jgi:stearoyl-CoA desaturase (delta-9 desaturase)
MQEAFSRRELLLAIIVTFFVAHWMLSVFLQSFFQHRYGAHRMFTMTKGWERFFYLCAFGIQGTSFLVPRAYAILHRQHHAFSDTERDPHSPHATPSLWKMMKRTLVLYHSYAYRLEEPEPRFEGGYPEWPFIDRLSQRPIVRFGFGAAYTIFYFAFAPHWGFYLLLPIHYLMGPIHGAIVNWCGHKYGYRNFAGVDGDQSRNTLVFDFVTLGELFQNNHHRFAMSPSFAVRWFEVDPAWLVIRLFAALRMIELLPHRQQTQWSPDRAAAHK